LVVQGALAYVFTMGAWSSLITSIAPVIFFIIVCYVTSSQTQLAIAGILTVIYALLMMAVMVGVIAALFSTSILDPTSIFEISLVGLYLITGILHPTEMMVLVHGLLYYVTVPSAFILLMIYSLSNMNNVSWGTREVPQNVQKAAAEVQKEKEKPKEQGKKSMLQAIGAQINFQDDDQGYSCGCGRIFQCYMCLPAHHEGPQQKVFKQVAPDPEDRKKKPTKAFMRRYSMAKAQITGVDAKEIQRKMSTRMNVNQLREMRNAGQGLTTNKVRRISKYHRRLSRKSTTAGGRAGMSDVARQLADELDNNGGVIPDFSDDEEDFEDFSDNDINEDRIKEEEDESLYWCIDGSLENSTIEYLDNEERDFWKYLIKHYLHPIDADKEKEAKIKEDLKTLRNKCTSGYYFANALWIVLNFAMQLSTEELGISYTVDGVVVTFNPAQITFLVFFLIILLIQFFCMLSHRWSTAMHILSTTSLSWNDSRDGFANERIIDIQKAEEAQKRKKERKQRDTNVAALEITDTNENLATVEDNFRVSRRDSPPPNSGYVNNAFDSENDLSMDEDAEDYLNQYQYGTTTRKKFGNMPYTPFIPDEDVRVAQPKKSIIMNESMFDNSYQLQSLPSSSQQVEVTMEPIGETPDSEDDAF